uniref:ribonuclease H2 subunit B isoform X2 n=1 Tax=Myxine glutinosa TaxID=7769 RepID=UPI00358E2243
MTHLTCLLCLPSPNRGSCSLGNEGSVRGGRVCVPEIPATSCLHRCTTLWTTLLWPSTTIWTTVLWPSTTDGPHVLGPSPSAGTGHDGPREIMLVDLCEVAPSHTASVVEEESETLSDPYFVKLKHPGTGKGAVFLFGQNGRRIFEVKSFSEKCHSWFIGDRVQEDGHLLYATPIDPLFLCLPYLLQEERKDRFEPLQQLLTDEDFPSCSNIIRCLNLQGQLRHISEIRASSDEKEFFCYSEENTLKWLQTKVERLVNAIRDAGVSVGGAVTSAMFVRSGQDEAVSHDEYRRYAHGLVSEYLPLALRLRLQMHLGIPEIKDEEEEGPPIKRRKMSSESPECATASSRNKTKSLIKAPKQNAAQRALAKVDRTGMKTLSCYFGKRA